MLEHGFRFGNPDCFGCCRHLPVDIRYCYPVGVHNGEIFEAGSYECLGRPAADASYSENYYFFFIEQSHVFFAEKKGGAVENCSRRVVHIFFGVFSTKYFIFLFGDFSCHGKNQHAKLAKIHEG